MVACESNHLLIAIKQFTYCIYDTMSHVITTGTKLRKVTRNIKDDAFDFFNFPSFREMKKLGESQNRDLILISSLTMISATLPNYYGEWCNIDNLSPHLYLFVVGKSGTGKSVALDILKYTIIDLHQELVSRVKEEWRCYGESLAAYKAGDIEERPSRPRFRALMIPSKITEAAFAALLEGNQPNGGLLATSEVDTFTGSMQGNYGCGLSEIIRCSFQHERYSKTVRGHNLDNPYAGFAEVNQPRLAVLFTGTDNQLGKLAGKNWENAYNGFLTRFLFYRTGGVPFELRNYSPIKEIDVKKLACSVKEMYYDLDRRAEPLRFELSVRLSDKLVKEFVQPFANRYGDFADEYRNLFTRMSISFFRLTMIFCAIRNKDKLATAKSIQAEETDLQEALRVFECLVIHTVEFNQLFIKYKPVSKVNPIAALRRMADRFVRDDFVLEMKGLGISERTAELWLTQLVDRYELLERIARGVYRKV